MSDNRRGGVRFRCVVTLCEPFRLSGHGEDRTPPTAGEIEAFGVRGEKFDRDVDETLVEEADDEAGLAGHRGVDGMAREEVAEQHVFAVRGAAADLVTRVEVAQDDGDTLDFKIRLDSLA